MNLSYLVMQLRYHQFSAMMNKMIHLQVSSLLELGFLYQITMILLYLLMVPKILKENQKIYQEN